jgi:hypothetical protein
MKKLTFLFVLILVSCVSIPLLRFEIQDVHAINEDDMLSIMSFKNIAIYSYPAAYNLSGYFWINVSSNCQTDFAFNNTMYPSVDMGYNGTTYAYKYTFDLKYYSSSATFSGFGIGDALHNTYAFLYYTSSSFYCRLRPAVLGSLGGDIDLPLGSWVSMSERILFNPNTNLYALNLSMWDYGHIDEAGHLLSSQYKQNSVGSFSGALNSSASDIGSGGSNLQLEIKNQNWYQPSGFYNLQVTSIPMNASVSLDGASFDSLPKNYSILAGVHTLTATTEVSVADPSIRYLFQGWSIDGSPITNGSNPLVFTPSADMTLQAIYIPIEIPDVVGLWANFGIGILGLIMMFLSWFVAYWCHKDGDTAKGILLWLAMFIIGYGFFTVLLGG